MWKKLMTAALVASMLILPVNSVSPDSSSEQAPAPSQVYEYLPGRVPAQVSAAESMSPALHALVLALMNHDAGRFDVSDSELAWEGLYNMLSLYGQLDMRSEAGDGTLLLPAETAADYAAALDTSLEQLGALPAALQDRITYSRSAGAYQVVCGESGLSRIEVRGTQHTEGGLQLTGALVYTPDGRDLARFQASLQPRDAMLGYAITAMTLTA